MKTNRHIIALNIAADQCRRLSAFLHEFSCEIDERSCKALTTAEHKKLNDEISGLLFEVANLVELTGESCQIAAAPDVPAPRIIN